MKILFKVSALILTVMMLSSCSYALAVRTPQPTSQTGPDILPSTDTPQGIWYNRLDFTVIPFDALPDTVRQWAEEKSHGTEKAAGRMNDGEYTYILAALGEQTSGGYDIEILSVADPEAGRYTVTIKTTVPEPGSVNTAALTYPAVVVRVAVTNLPMDFVNTDGSCFME